MGIGPHCGDGEVDPVREQCDDANPEQGDGCNIDCVESGTLVWELRLTTDSANGRCGGVAVTEDSEMLVSTNGAEPRIVKISSAGEEVWSNGFTLTDSTADDVAVAPNGDVAVIAYDGPTILVSRWSSDGAALWSRQYENLTANGYADYGRGLAADADGNLLAVGARSQAQGNVSHDVFLRRYSADGDVFWTRILADQQVDEYANAAVASISAGHYVAYGVLSDPGGNRRPWVGAITNDNSQAWNYYDAEAEYGDEYHDVAVGPDGSIAVAGVGGPTSDEVISVVKLSPAGELEWARTVDNFDGVDELGQGVAISSDGTVVVAGLASGGWLGKFSADGESLLWTTAQPDADNGFFDVEVDPEDNVYVCGGRPSRGNPALYDVWVAKLTP
jgi:cysteine-rich repeat protein